MAKNIERSFNQSLFITRQFASTILASRDPRKPRPLSCLAPPLPRHRDLRLAEIYVEGNNINNMNDIINDDIRD